MASSGGNKSELYSIYLKLNFLFFTILSQVYSLSMKAELYDSRSFEFIRTSSYPHFVMFYAPWCGHCKRVKPVWDKYSEENHKSRRMKVAKVDCTESTPLCSAENIKAYPTFILYSNRFKHTFRGNRDIPDFTQFVNSKVSDLRDGQVPIESISPKKDPIRKSDKPVLPKVLTSATFEDEIASDYTFVDFYAPWCSHCIKLEPTWNKLADALKYSEKLTIAKVDCTADPELCQSRDINGYPTLNLYKDGLLVSSYTQSRSLASLIEFVQTYMSIGSENDRPYDSGALQPDDGGDTISSPPDDNIEEKLSDDTFKESISKTAHLIYFHDSGPQFSNMDLLIFEQVQSRLRYAKMDVAVAVIDCTKSVLVCKELGITAYPSILYFKSLNEYSRYRGTVDVERLLEFVESEMKKSEDDLLKEEL